jgi:hypothetical protein
VLGLLALVLFAGAAALTGERIAAPGVPSASDVRAARNLAVALAEVAAADEPSPVTASIADMEGAARVLTNGVPRLRLSPRVADDALAVKAAFRLSDGTWLTGGVRIAEVEDYGYPRISANIGTLPIPALLLEPLLGLAHKAAEMRAGTRFPTTREAILAFEAGKGTANVVLDLPQGLLKGVSKLAPSDDAIDGRLANRLYVAAHQRLGGRAVDLPEVYAALFKVAPRTGEAARRHARAAMVAAAMLVVGPRAGRLARDGEASFSPMLPATLSVTLAGRDDLAKHFTLSAALAAAADPAIGRALGTWKELDDSLAGGSGFSFVDLAADRAGLRLGEAATSPVRAGTLSSRFAAGVPELLPLAALGFGEGMGTSTFEHRYRDVSSAEYAEAVARIDRALDTLPVMQR